MARRGENIRKRQDGRWEARFIEEYQGGKAKYRCVYAKSYKEVKAKREEFVVRLQTGKLPPVQKFTTLNRLAVDWLNNIRRSVKESTYTRYQRTVNRYILPELGKYPLYRLEAELINSYSGKLAETLAAKTILDILVVLKQILRYGERNNLPSCDLKRIAMPKRSSPVIQIVEEHSRGQLEQVLRESRNEICVSILLTIYTGIRIGELCGLQWGDISFPNGTLKIRRTVERIAETEPLAKQKTKVVITEPKTELSRRVIPLPSFLISYLYEKRKADSCYIVTGTEKPSEPHTVYMRYVRFLKSNRLEQYTFHALRHTFATHCVELGFDTKSLSEILGHSNVTTTLRCYVHPSLEAKRAQMERLEPEGMLKK